METQTKLSCHYKFISAGNITILSVSSDEFLFAILEVAEQQMFSVTLSIAYKRSSDETGSIVIFFAEIYMTT